VSDLFFGEFSTDVTPPAVSNLLPLSGATGVPKSSNVEFDITDTEAGVDTGSVVVVVDGNTAYDGGAGGFQAGYITGSSFADIGGGTRRMVIDGPDFSSFVTIVVTVDGQDLASLPNVMAQFSWSFETVDDTAPAVTNNAPTGSSELVSVLIEFDLSDAGVGVDIETVVVTVGGVEAYNWDGVGVPDDGFKGDFVGGLSAVTGNSASYHFVIDKTPDYDEWVTYEVIVNADDLAP
jgi:hypothetical protein